MAGAQTRTVRDVGGAWPRRQPLHRPKSDKVKGEKDVKAPKRDTERSATRVPPVFLTTQDHARPGKPGGLPKPTHDETATGRWAKQERTGAYGSEVINTQRSNDGSQVRDVVVRSGLDSSGAVGGVMARRARTSSTTSRHEMKTCLLRVQAVR